MFAFWTIWVLVNPKEVSLRKFQSLIVCWLFLCKWGYCWCILQVLRDIPLNWSHWGSLLSLGILELCVGCFCWTWILPTWRELLWLMVRFNQAFFGISQLLSFSYRRILGFWSFSSHLRECHWGSSVSPHCLSSVAHSWLSDFDWCRPNCRFPDWAHRRKSASYSFVPHLWWKCSEFREYLSIL